MRQTPLDNWIYRKHGLDTDDPKALVAYQLRRICHQITYAHNHSPFYRLHFRDYALPHTLTEFMHFPIMDERDLINCGKAMLCVSQNAIVRITTLKTSGTTQRSKRVYFTKQDIERTLDFFRNGMKTMAYSGQHALILFPSRSLSSVGSLLSDALDKLGLYVVCSDAINAIDILRTSTFDLVCGPVSQVVKVAKHTPNVKIDAVLTSSDTLSQTDRNFIESMWQCQVYDHYGMTESGLGGAVECDAHQGMHIRVNDLYFEVVDSEGKEVSGGVEGDLLMTTLTAEGMPFIRYRTGDRAIITKNRCVCGSMIPRLLMVHRDHM